MLHKFCFIEDTIECGERIYIMTDTSISVDYVLKLLVL